MVSISDEQVAELSSRLELISARSNKNAGEIRQLLQELDEQNQQLGKRRTADSAYMRIRLLQYDVLVRKFTDALGAFEQTENEIQDKNRDLLVRRFKIVRPELETRQILDAIEEDSAINVFALAAGTEDLERKLEHLRAQRRSMARLERSILTLNRMFLDMQALVLAQGETLSHIESYTQQTVEWQQVTHVDQAIEYRKNIRKVPGGWGEWMINVRVDSMQHPVSACKRM